jgi:hypothetical protein
VRPAAVDQEGQPTLFLCTRGHASFLNSPPSRVAQQSAGTVRERACRKDHHTTFELHVGLVAGAYVRKVGDSNSAAILDPSAVQVKVHCVERVLDATLLRDAALDYNIRAAKLRNLVTPVAALPNVTILAPSCITPHFTPGSDNITSGGAGLLEVEVATVG